MVRAAPVLLTRARLASDALLPSQLLIPKFPAVLDLRQNGPDLSDVLLPPKSDSNTANPNNRRKRNLLGRDVAVQRSETESELFSRIASGNAVHYGYDLYQIDLRMSSRTSSGR